MRKIRNSRRIIDTIMINNTIKKEKKNTHTHTRRNITQIRIIRIIRGRNIGRGRRQNNTEKQHHKKNNTHTKTKNKKDTHNRNNNKKKPTHKQKKTNKKNTHQGT